MTSSWLYDSDPASERAGSPCGPTNSENPTSARQPAFSEDREGSPSAGIIDSQTIKSAEKGAVKPRNRPPTQPTRWVTSLEGR